MSNKNNIARWTVGTLLMVVVGLLLWYFRSTVVYILVSAVLAIVGGPVVRLLSGIKIGKVTTPRWAAALITLVAMWVVLVSFCLLIVPIVVEKVTMLAQLDLRGVLSNIQQPIEKVQNYLESLMIVG